MINLPQYLKTANTDKGKERTRRHGVITAHVMLRAFLVVLESGSCSNPCLWQNSRMQNPRSVRTYKTSGNTNNTRSYDQQEQQTGKAKGRGRGGSSKKTSLGPSRGSIGKYPACALRKTVAKSSEIQYDSPSANSVRSERLRLSFRLEPELPQSQPRPLQPQRSKNPKLTTQQQERVESAEGDAYDGCISCRLSKCSCGRRQHGTSTHGLSAVDWKFLRRLIDSLENDRLQREALIRRLDEDRKQRERHQLRWERHAGLKCTATECASGSPNLSPIESDAYETEVATDSDVSSV